MESILPRSNNFLCQSFVEVQRRIVSKQCGDAVPQGCADCGSILGLRRPSDNCIADKENSGNIKFPTIDRTFDGFHEQRWEDVRSWVLEWTFAQRKRWREEGADVALTLIRLSRLLHCFGQKQLYCIFTPLFEHETTAQLVLSHDKNRGPRWAFLPAVEKDDIWLQLSWIVHSNYQSQSYALIRLYGQSVYALTIKFMRYRRIWDG